MSEQTGSNSERDTLTQLQSLSNSNRGITIEEIAPFLKSLPENISMPVLHALINLGSNQVGIWKSQWLFSFANSPNTTAKAESERWSNVRDKWLDLLSELAPDLRELLQRQNKLTEFGHHLTRSLDYNKTKPFKRITSSILSYLSMFMGKLGFDKIGERLYARALFPKGTVGGNL
ncbi:MAG: hypothetical protein HY807_00145 [Nitrospirae bacterium]|nr:hypothetical protein [Nitrospirota bacterium]